MSGIKSASVEVSDSYHQAAAAGHDGKTWRAPYIVHRLQLTSHNSSTEVMTVRPHMYIVYCVQATRRHNIPTQVRCLAYLTCTVYCGQAISQNPYTGKMIGRPHMYSVLCIQVTWQNLYREVMLDRHHMCSLLCSGDVTKSVHRGGGWQTSCVQFSVLRWRHKNPYTGNMVGRPHMLYELCIQLGRPHMYWCVVYTDWQTSNVQCAVYTGDVTKSLRRGADWQTSRVHSGHQQSHTTPSGVGRHS